MAHYLYDVVTSPVSQITESLYLTDKTSASSYEVLQYLAINCVISATVPHNVPTPDFPDIEFIRIPIRDHPSTNISAYFDDVADKIDQVYRRGGRTLVNCYAGVSRSSTLVMAYLMKYRGLTLNEAYGLVMRQRPIINPNCGFWKQLIRYEKKLFKHNSVFMGDVNC